MLRDISSRLILKQQNSQQKTLNTSRTRLAGPNEVIVVRIDLASAFSDAAAILDTLKYNWVALMAATEQQDLATYI